MADDGTVRVIDVREDFPASGTYVDVEAYRVPVDKDIPKDVSYSMQYGTYEGTTLLRSDNFPDPPGAGRHHKHTPDSVEDVDFDGLKALFRRSCAR
jgi:hypothetical protein